VSLFSGCCPSRACKKINIGRLQPLFLGFSSACSTQHFAGIIKLLKGIYSSADTVKYFKTNVQQLPATYCLKPSWAYYLLRNLRNWIVICIKCRLLNHNAENGKHFIFISCTVTFTTVWLNLLKFDNPHRSRSWLYRALHGRIEMLYQIQYRVSDTGAR